jgi:hypothetical protein
MSKGIGNIRLNLSVSKVDEGFYVPSVRFALVMQLAHIQRHFLAGGIQ